MNTTDPIADMLTRIRNATLVRQRETWIPFSNIKLSIAQILQQEGFISDVQKMERDGHQGIQVQLKYVDGESAIRGLKRVSKPGLRRYNGYLKFPRHTPQLGVAIISTSRGIMTHLEAKRQKVGGEILCEIY
ncbi:MAG: 30S ribosomal protein S8 [Candidatus Kerfeldbacteria bacterium RIFCSPLOWO2_01_FULL_48_11]|uniref:Small ribosomal subunit protein uS8 n=1 Tax=Candidatus Kerfeldbacteria bacterium RIFCSPLOWO2_01_FULL_48_11 TaxID=1798543 RepID=A0A1G2B5G3_9BACT|nr:MAG: 30S ribosomal protein S8 [Parcubacteria group bacterium GW2011_GWA2_48_9]KKW15812.1 MAG: 30S ribosomal protein S8 [Parcubacteria group bacterium GW2011_GWC2_49_9]OGY84382.1 MAG: 30S ribosomal protein S8 [Candidatus Kerfeldbacteria bacterium RIFCSPLOWO2_01_FULL_48_11]HCJ52203.1 30S ribosomal protein S8 [Candidatus Kerfeldbacteria bacterium]HCM68513.1 30S ribosomal protein S8 [Candidatus Kerfeldbacteria bacterium]